MSYLNKINIGEFGENIKKISIESEYKIKQILINPFGSNKQRFHFPSCFYIKFENDNIIYNITIYKTKNKDLSNSLFFIKNGWTNDLSLCCIMENFKLTHTFILNYIPYNYGTIEISNIVEKEKEQEQEQKQKIFRVGIIIPTYGRLEYVKKTFESLIKCNLTNCILIIVDESLTKDINDDKIQTNLFIKEFNFKIPTIKIYKNRHGNMYESINIGLDIIGHRCEYLMNLDSDTIQNVDFIEKILNVYIELKKKHPDKLIIVSGFNTISHKIIEHANDNENQNYYIKHTIGGCHLCFSSEDYWNYIRYTLISYKWDTNIYNLTNKLNGIIVSTRPSVIEHIGEISSVRGDGLKCVKSIDFKYSIKFHIISEDFIFSNSQTWIIDTFKKEFMKYSNLTFTEIVEESDIVWIIGINLTKIKYLKTINLKNKKIITTIHHIDFEKINKFNNIFNEFHDITTYFHVICDKVYNDLYSLTNKKIVVSNFWINENIFFNISNKIDLRKKYNICKKSYCIGSFQRDTEGKNKSLIPKLSKGPDVFIKIAIDIKKNNDNLLIILTGRNRNYIIDELEKNLIKYMYFPMVTSQELNELYNCLDLYIVSSRVEGGPRAIIECGIAKIPIISTNVGISNLILSEKSIYDMNNFITYKTAETNILHAYTQSNKYSISNYMHSFIHNVFEI